MNGFWSSVLIVLGMSLGFVLFFCAFIVAGFRFGWFFWLSKKILSRRSKQQSSSQGSSPSTEHAEKESIKK